MCSKLILELWAEQRVLQASVAGTKIFIHHRGPGWWRCRHSLIEWANRLWWAICDWNDNLALNSLSRGMLNKLTKLDHQRCTPSSSKWNHEKVVKKIAEDCRMEPTKDQTQDCSGTNCSCTKWVKVSCLFRLFRLMTSYIAHLRANRNQTIDVSGKKLPHQFCLCSRCITMR